jgi:hypothetical protein
MKSIKRTVTSYGCLVEGKEKRNGRWVEFKAKCNHQDLEIERRRSDESSYIQEWVQLENGHWRMSKYSSDDGDKSYTRVHIYDLKTGRVIEEWDSARNKNLVDKRVQSIQRIKELTITDVDYLISLELENEMKPKDPPPPKVNSLF